MPGKSRNPCAPRFDFASFAPTFRLVSQAKLFPDYAKLFGSAGAARRIAEAIQPTLATAMDDRLIEAIRPTLGVDMEKLSAAIRPAVTFKAASDFADVVRGIGFAPVFPDYSKVFPGVETARLFREYAAAMPAATRVAESYVVDDVLPEMEEPPAEEADPWEWVTRLTPEKRHELAH